MLIVETSSVCTSAFYIKKKKSSNDGLMRVISVSMIKKKNTAVSATKVRTISSVLVTDCSRRTEEK